MAILTKRATVYFDPDLHRLLKVKAAEINTSISELIDSIIRREMEDDVEDLHAFNERINEPTVTYESLLNDLKKNGKI